MKQFRSPIEQRKSSAKVDDGQPNWLRTFLLENPELTHLYQLPKRWKTPKGLKLLHYSRRKQSALDYERLRKERRGLPFSE